MNSETDLKEIFEGERFVSEQPEQKQFKPKQLYEKQAD